MKRGFIFIISVLFVAKFANAQVDLKAAKNLTMSERFEDASELYKSLIQQNPGNGDVYFYYGVNMLDEYLSDPYSKTKSEVISSANAMFNEGKRKDSLNPLNNVGLGMVILFDNGDTINADKYLNKALATIPAKPKKYTPKNLEVLINLAKAELYSENPRIKKALKYMDNAQIYTAKTNADVFTTTGDVYIAAGKPSEAIANYNSALYLDDKNVVLMVKIGNIYIRAKNPNSSKELFEQAKAIDSTFAPLYKGLGEVYYMTGYYKLSKVNYKNFLELSGNNIPAKVSYIISLFKSKDYVECLNQIEELQKVDNSRNFLNRLAAYCAYDKRPADYNKALTYIETFFKNATPDKIITKDYYYYGRILIKVGQDDAMIDKGIEMLQKAYDEDNTNQDVLNELASDAYQTKHFPVAVEMFTKKINGGQGNTDDYMYLGKTYYQMGNCVKADSVFLAITQKEPENLQAYLWSANSRAKCDPDFKDVMAKAAYELLIQKAKIDTVKNKKEMMEGYSFMSSYYLFAPKPDFDKAENFAYKMISLDPINKTWQVKGYKTLALIYTKKKDYNTAIKFYKKVLTIDPADADAQNAIDLLNRAIRAQQQAAQQ
jgi:tetratricopeptide (TPR) repeat protein